MPTTTSLSGSHLRTYQTIFQHPISHNLGWHDVHALFSQLGQVEEKPNGNLQVTRNGQILVLYPSRTKDVTGMEEVMALRHFLERSETPLPVTNDTEGHWLLVIDRHEARIFRSTLSGGVPQQILPHELEEDFRPARGQEKPDHPNFFEPVAKALHAATQILVFGSGTGKSSEMDQFIAWLKIHYADLAGRIIGLQVVDQHHLSEDQLLAKAREFYAKGAAPRLAS